MVLAATLCFTTVFALPVWAEGTDGAVQGPVAVGETVNSSAENPAPQTEPTVESNGQLEALSHVVEDVQDQLNKVKMEAVLAVGFGFAALVLSVIALLMSLRKTVSAGSNAQGSNDSAEWKKLNQNIQQIEQQLQKLAQKQEKDTGNGQKLYADTDCNGNRTKLGVYHAGSAAAEHLCDEAISDSRAPSCAKRAKAACGAVSGLMKKTTRITLSLS